MTGKTGKLLAVAATMAVLGAARVNADEASDARIRELENKVAALENRTTLSSKETAAVVEGVLRDAERRSTLLAAADSGAGFDNGFYIRSGDFSLQPGILFQFRNITDYRDDAKGSDDSDTQNGFEVRRLRFILAGNAFSKDLTYRFAWDTNREGGGLYLLDAWVNYKFNPCWGVRLGQIVDPLSHEHQMFPGKVLATEVSVANELVGGGLTERVQAVELRYGMYGKDNPVNVELAFHDGGNSKNTDFADTKIDPVSGKDVRPDWGVAGRIEAKAMGNWASYQDFTAVGNKEDLLVFGAAFDITGTTDMNVIYGSADVQGEFGGLAVYGALYVRHRDMRHADDQTDWGGLVQAAYAFNPNIEVFARYSVVKFDSDFVPGEDTVHEITVGGNYYFFPSLPHGVKFTLDLNYLPNGTPPLTGLGYLGGTGEDEWVLRGQFQLSI